MKNPILSAALAALAFAGCDQTSTVEAKIAPPPPQTRTSAAMELAGKKTPKPDAGQLTQAEPVPEIPADPIAIAHDQPKVDHLERAKQLKSDGDFAGALTESRRALYNDAENEDALAFISKMASRVGQHELSAQAYGRIATLREDDAVPLIAQTRELIAARASSSRPRSPAATP